MQAACPFKAFAKLRLGAKALEETEAGLPAKSRGSILHKALELFWKDVKDQKTLKELSTQTLADKIHQTITRALSEQAAFIDKATLYYTLVHARLKKLLSSWLDLEKTRPPFTVAAIEEEKSIQIDDFSLSIRVDRIDELSDGEKLIIDYKTKKNCDTNDWFGLRPDEPQLPLYCITNQEAIVGLAFAQLHTSQIEIKGLTQKDLKLASLKMLTEKSKADATTWEAQMQQWQLNLMQLFRDFQSGNATVDPKNPAETCRYCDLQTFCRIHENGSFSHD
jgi:ATP-dependent helicase/nuclease subunit B